MYNDLAKILISKEEIDKRIKELAAKLDEDYCGKRPLMVCILKGSTMFYADLLRAMTISLEMDFMAISSYGNKTKSSGEVRMITVGITSFILSISSFVAATILWITSGGIAR